MTSKRSEWRVVGHANRLALPQKFLDFCGSFPIYYIEQASEGREGRTDVINVITKMKGSAEVNILFQSPRFVTFAQESPR